MDVFLIKDGVAVNVISADSVEKAQEFYPDHLCLERTVELVGWGPGDLYDGTTWTKSTPPATPPAPITKLEFLRRFTPAQRIAIRAASATDPVIMDGMSMLDLAQDVLVTDPDTVYFVNYLKDGGFITQTDVDVILG